MLPHHCGELYPETHTAQGHGWLYDVPSHVRRSPQMSGQGDKLSRKQEQGISALLLHLTLLEAATAIGVDERTLRRWLREDTTFQAAYREARRGVVQHGITQV